MSKRNIFKVLLTFILSASLLLFFNAVRQKKEKLTVCMDDDHWISGCKDNELNSNVIKELSKKISIIINPVILSKNDYLNNLNSLLKSDSKPDVFLAKFAVQWTCVYAKKNEIMPLDDFIKNSPNAQTIKYFCDFYPNIDGKIYFIPYDKPSAKIIWINQELYDKYDLKLSNNPTTEDFFNEMMKIIEKDKEIIPLTFSKYYIENMRFFFNSFGAVDDIYLKDGKIIDGFDTQEMTAALLYIKKLYLNGIINKSFNNIDDKESRSSLIDKKSAAILDFWYRYLFFADEMRKKGNSADFKPIYKITGPDGKGGGSIIEGTYGWVISKSCKNPEAAFKFIENQVFDFDIRQTTAIGLQNCHYIINDRGYIQAKDEASKSGYRLLYIYAFQSIPDYSKNTFYFSKYDKEFMPKLLMFSNEYYKHLQPNYPKPYVISKSYDYIYSNLKKYREDIIYKIITDEITLEKGYEDYKNYWQSINGDVILNELNAALKTN